jgi:hypothetical protein
MPTLVDVPASQIPGEREEISRDFFPIGKEINEDHVRQLYGMECNAWSQEDFRQAIEALKQKKREAKSWGKGSLEKMIVEAAQANGISVLNMTELKSKFREDSSQEFAAKMWQTVHGTFDMKPGWDRIMEETYMDFAELTYSKNNNGDEKKGCIAKLFNEVKKETVKSINRAGNSGHGGKVRLKRTKEEVEQQGLTKRKKGETLGTFFTLHKGAKFSPSKLVGKSPEKTKVAKKSPEKTKVAKKPANNSNKNDTTGSESDVVSNWFAF